MHIGDPIRTCGKYMNWGIQAFAGMLALGAGIQLVKIPYYCAIDQDSMGECLQEHNYAIIINILSFPAAKGVSKIGEQILNKMNQYADQLENQG